MRADFPQRILVLNRLWQAVNIIGVRRAFGLLCQGHAKAIYSESNSFQTFGIDEWMVFSAENPPAHGENCVRTVRRSIRIPNILLLTEFDRLPLKEVKFTRQSLFERDNYTCQYCGRTLPERQLNFDHVIPRDRGGQTSWENIVTSCVRCNEKKANRLPHEAGLSLMRMPRRPRRRPVIAVAPESVMHESWTHFIHVSDS